MPEHRPIFSCSPRHTYTIPSGRNLYLDTSAIRRIGSGLERTPRAHEAYTSALAVIELLGGILKSDREFDLRRAAIGGLLRSPVAIDWRMPTIPLMCSFPPLRPKYDLYEERTVSLQQLLECLAPCSTAEMFAASELVCNLTHHLDYFVQLDDSISGATIRAFEKWVPYNRERFADPSTQDLLETLGLSRQSSLAGAARALAGSEFDLGLGLFAITRQLAEEEGEYSEIFHDELFRSYDHTADLFMRASSHQLWREIGLAARPGRNAGTDLAHFQYVVEGSYVVTADDGMAAQVVQAGGAVLSVVEFGAA